MKAKSIILTAAVALGSFVLPTTTAEAGRHGHRYYRDGSRAVVVYAPASRRYYYNRPVRYYNRPVQYYQRPYYSGPGVSVRVNVW